MGEKTSRENTGYRANEFYVKIQLKIQITHYNFINWKLNNNMYKFEYKGIKLLTVNIEFL